MTPFNRIGEMGLIPVSPSTAPCVPFCTRRFLNLRQSNASFRFAVAHSLPRKAGTPLPLANDFYYQAHSGLAAPSYLPCTAHKTKTFKVLI